VALSLGYYDKKDTSYRLHGLDLWIVTVVSFLYMAKCRM
jgi:hypothetical protein